MPETSDTSQNQKQEESWKPGLLTEQQIESLRLDKRETHKRINELWDAENAEVKEKMIKIVRG